MTSAARVPEGYLPPLRKAYAPRNRGWLRFLQWVYDFCYLTLVLVVLPVIVFQMIVSSRWRTGLLQRLGFCPVREGDRPAIFIHGVSAGEALGASKLVTLIAEELPWADVVISTTTSNGQAAARRMYPDKQVFYYPLDFSFATRRVVDRMRPSVVLLMELELWPNFLLSTSLRGVPVLLANGRMSGKSARDYRILQRVIPEPMTRVIQYCVQSQEYWERFRSLGVPESSLAITGSMKFDTIAEDLPAEVRSGYARRLGVDAGAFVFVAGSTHAGEEQVVLDAYDRMRAADPGVRLVLVPRHPDRVREVDALLRARGYPSAHISDLSADSEPDERIRDTVVVGDTMGELAKLYGLADVVFVGGTLTKRGGQNMMEPCGLGKAVVVGPNTWNFRDPMELLLTRAGILQVPDAAAVVETLVALHGDPVRREHLGNNARQVCLESKGATRRILDILREYVPSPRQASVAGDTDDGRNTDP